MKGLWGIIDEVHLFILFIGYSHYNSSATALVSVTKDQLNTDLDREMFLSLREKEWKLKQSRADSATPRNYFAPLMSFSFPGLQGKPPSPHLRSLNENIQGKGGWGDSSSWFWRLQPLYSTTAHILMSPPSELVSDHTTNWTRHQEFSNYDGKGIWTLQAITVHFCIRHIMQSAGPCAVPLRSSILISFPLALPLSYSK